MSLGEKIAKQRRRQNYTQEQLAELLGVSRQSVSKWESDTACPETEKLVRMGKLFGCSMDYLLNDGITEENGRGDEQPSASFPGLLRERKSEKTVMGMPLYHIGRNARGFFALGLNARGVFAVGLLARGVVSLGLLSIGAVSVGLLALGLVGLGCFALGGLALGAVALGVLAGGAISVGVFAFGALSVGCFSCGALAIGRYAALGDRARAMIAVGRTEAAGTVFRCYADEMTGGDLSRILRWLDGNVPGYLSWAKNLFRLILNG